MFLEEAIFTVGNETQGSGWKFLQKFKISYLDGRVIIKANRPFKVWRQIPPLFLDLPHIYPPNDVVDDDCGGIADNDEMMNSHYIPQYTNFENCFGL